jgi:hypothetical protein
MGTAQRNGREAGTSPTWLVQQGGQGSLSNCGATIAQVSPNRGRATKSRLKHHDSPYQSTACASNHDGPPAL